ncbi:MobP3 family relaxase [[Clostridium] symbiosum]|uniref:MobP3 family relaxase n=1 Tax=Clostridium symbiosum TaxID=1512 RepID=UPI001D06B59F|nr:MobP3 family relaxase [[Clostridium] symbiosum]MCB6607146.1 relaxase MobL [[Clostridium] symbiosum]MCB6929706.1 relaxase MobL [[Clostridium] symbiosum]
MPKIIFTSRYMRDAPQEQLGNYVKYIGTREGVEKIDESKRHLPSTAAQKKLMLQILRDMPETKEMLEYGDYVARSTIGNASEFISCALEQNLDLLGKRKNYVDYLANRPRAERVGEHGLFTDAGKPVVLKKVQEEVGQHKGAVWTHVVSLRRGDAARLGYDSGKQWMELLRSKRAMFSKYMKIDSENLRWYAAYHNESHHPHVHIMVYSAKDNDGFLTEPAIEAMRSELAHSIFRQDFANLYEEQNKARADLKTEAAKTMKKMLCQIKMGVTVTPEIEKKMVLLSKRLKNSKGKKVYGYLKADVKQLVDRIVDELGEEPRVKNLYEMWGNWGDQIRSTYSSQPVLLPPLSQQKQFKSIKNMVIAEALQIGGHHFLFEEESDESEADGEGEAVQELETFTEEMDLPEGAGPTEIRAEWSNVYRLARTYLYGTKKTEPDFEEAFRLFLQEAESGNALAMYDLARMFADGLGRQVDMQSANEWYQKALTAFLSAELLAEERRRPYLQYRIGKMYAAGLGTEQDYKKAATWLSKAVAQNHKYAQYSLAGLYYRGQGVQQDYKQALLLYQRSASQSNPYASYELAKMYRDGIGTEKDDSKAQEHFRQAFFGFTSLEAESHDDKLQYRLGQMLYTGTGSKKDEEAAATYWEKAAKIGNVNAQYALGRHWLEHQIGDPGQAVRWIQKAAEGEHAAALYVLAKLYLEGTSVEQDIGKAVELFVKAAAQSHDFAAYRLGKLYLAGELIEKDISLATKWLSEAAAANNPYAQYTLGKIYLAGEETDKDIAKAVEYFRYSSDGGNDYAAYQLGKIYLTGEDVLKDVEEAIKWLSQSAEKGNQYAQYALGKLYLCGHDVPRDKEKAIPLLEASAAQGNIYAQFLLDHLDSFRDPSSFLAATRLMHQLAKIFEEEEQRGRGAGAVVERKLRRRIQEKKAAQGHKRDDHEPKQTVY